MALKKPNTICKNQCCTKGIDGGRKHYYACRYCTHSENWRSMACSWECYLAYQAQLIEARDNNEPIDLIPERTDMTREEVIALINETPTEQVIEETMAELADVLIESSAMGFDQIADAINEELDAIQKKRSKRNKKEE